MVQYLCIILSLVLPSHLRLSYFHITPSFITRYIASHFLYIHIILSFVRSHQTFTCHKLVLLFSYCDISLTIHSHHTVTWTFVSLRHSLYVHNNIHISVTYIFASHCQYVCLHRTVTYRMSASNHYLSYTHNYTFTCCTLTSHCHLTYVCITLSLVLSHHTGTCNIFTSHCYLLYICIT